MCLQETVFVCLCGSVSLQDRLAPMSAYEKNVSVSTHRRETGATIDAYRHMRHMRWQVMDNLHTATYCNTLQHSAYGTYSAHGTYEAGGTDGTFNRRTCTLQHAATHCTWDTWDIGFWLMNWDIRFWSMNYLHPTTH